MNNEVNQSVAVQFASPDRMAIHLLIAGGFVTLGKANEALAIAHGFTVGPLESIDSASSAEG